MHIYMEIYYCKGISWNVHQSCSLQDLGGPRTFGTPLRIIITEEPIPKLLIDGNIWAKPLNGLRNCQFIHIIFQQSYPKWSKNSHVEQSSYGVPLWSIYLRKKSLPVRIVKINQQNSEIISHFRVRNEMENITIFIIFKFPIGTLSKVYHICEKNHEKTPFFVYPRSLKC